MGKWAWLVITRDKETLTTYINGVACASTKLTSSEAEKRAAAAARPPAGSRGAQTKAELPPKLCIDPSQFELFGAGVAAAVGATSEKGAAAASESTSRTCVTLLASFEPGVTIIML